VIGCEQGKICGYCGYGCAIGAKQSTVKTWLADAQKHGAKLVVETRAEKVRVERGVATGVEAWSKKATGGSEVQECGGGVRAIHTAALLLRSELETPTSVGTCICIRCPISAVYLTKRFARGGTMQAIYSDQHQQLDRKLWREV